MMCHDYECPKCGESVSPLVPHVCPVEVIAQPDPGQVAGELAADRAAEREEDQVEEKRDDRTDAARLPKGKKK